MRLSNNPNKGAKTIEVPQITLGMITHYTDDPYHASRMEVVKASIESMLLGVMCGYSREFIIYDNGSTDEFRKTLRSFKPDVLVESYNVGKSTALHNLCSMARGGIFCYSDDDILFTFDWLQKQIEVLKIFPNVGLVNGSPQRVQFKHAVETEKKFPGAEFGRFIPDEWEQDYCRSIGDDYARHAESNKNVQDILLKYNGVKAWGHGHHMQFTSYRDVVLPFLKRNNILLADERNFDSAIDEAGLMRLTTYQRTCRHIGNVL